MHERGADKGRRLEQTRRDCLDRERWLLWPFSWEMFPEGMRHQKL